MQNADVIILGNGLIAKTLALAFEKIGLNPVRIARAHPEYPNDPRSYAIAPSSQKLFQALGLQIQTATPVSRVELAFGDTIGDVTYPLETGVNLFSMIDHNVLNGALDAELKSSFIEGEPTEFEISDFAVTLPEFERTAPLMIVAEGKFSASLARLGFGFVRHDYEQTAITAKFETEIPHQGIARQLFESTGPLGLLPFGENGLSIVWSQQAETAQALLALDEDEFVDFLESKIHQAYGTLKITHPRASFPLFGAIATRLTAPRIALLGDSAHAIHPIAGQGLNLGIRDVACMVETIRNASRIGLDIGTETILHDYANWRQGDIARLNTLTRGMNALTQDQNPFAQISLATAQSTLALKPIQDWMANMSDAALSPQPPLLEGRLY